MQKEVLKRYIDKIEFENSCIDIRRHNIDQLLDKIRKVGEI